MSQDPIRESVVVSLSPAELEEMIGRVVRNELMHAGVYVEDAKGREESRADFGFLRRVRRAYDSMVSKIGAAVVLALVGGLVWLIVQGAKVWTRL